MADTINTKRNYRAAARPVFQDMRRVLERIRDDEDLQTCMSVDLAREIDDVLDRLDADMDEEPFKRVIGGSAKEKPKDEKG
jgi:hypothetical protein